MILVDADILLYQACSAAEEETDWGDDVWSLTTDLKEAKAMFQDRLAAIEERLNSHKVTLCISDKENFRKTVYPNYKSNRKKTRKPLGYPAMVEWARGRYDCITLPGLEADDVLGIFATMPPNKAQAIMVSDDKDLRTIPGRLYRPMSDELMTITEAEADYNFLLQTLTGDTTDGYPGLKGYGPKTAEKLLGSRPAWSLVEQAYIKAGQTREDALVQARLARILRWTDWDAQDHKPILFTGETKSHEAA
jgi:DNA polymerase-1